MTELYTEKFKDITVEFRFVKKYDAKTKALHYLLAKMMGEYSEKYQDKLSMTKAKDMLYGLNVATSAKVRGGLCIYGIRFSFINPSYRDDFSTQEVIDFMKECLLHPYFDQKLMDEVIRNYKDGIQRRFDKPQNLESHQLIQEIAKDSPSFGQYDMDISLILDTISLEELQNEYHSLWKEYRLETFLIGKYGEEILNFVKSFSSPVSPLSFENVLVKKEEERVVEHEKETDQSYLSIVYQTPYVRAHEDFYAFLVGNLVFGGLPVSLLFEEVREKKSLCYSITTQDYKNEGLVRVVTGIDAKNKDIVVEEVNKQFARMQKGDFEQERLEAAKALLMNSILSIPDDVEAYSDYLFYNRLNGISLSIEEYMNAVSAVKKEDIVKVFGQYRPYLTHFLKGGLYEETLS